jgi:hypothetical protein
LFTYPEQQITEFSEELSQLLYTTIPAKFRKRMAEFDEKNLLSDSLHDFLYEKPEIKVVFSIRSDRMAQMNMLTDRHPSILQNYYELNALDPEQAVAAIVEPARLPQKLGFKTPPFELTDEAVNKILNNITDAQDKKIEVSTLQIVCRYIEETLVGEKKHLLITEDILGNITDIFLQYYEKVLNKLQPGERIKAQHLIEDELIFEGRRNALTAGYIQKKFDLSEELLVTLEKSSLLKKERDAAGRLLYEISHDSLIAPINKVAESRRTIENEHKQRELEEQIQNERKRTEELVVLNQRARNRSRIAIALAIVCIGIALAAVVFWRKATTAEQVARDKADAAEKAKKETGLQKSKVDILLANQLIKDADFYLKEDSVTWALNRVDEAENILNSIKDSLPADIEQQKQNAFEDCELKRRQIELKKSEISDN